MNGRGILSILNAVFGELETRNDGFTKAESRASGGGRVPTALKGAARPEAHSLNWSAEMALLYIISYHLSIGFLGQAKKRQGDKETGR